MVLRRFGIIGIVSFGAVIASMDPAIGASPPSPPASVEVSVDATSVHVVVAPGADGGSPITGYTASCASVSGATRSAAGSNPLTLIKLTGGATYTCSARAVNALGRSGPTVSSAFVAPATKPAPPTSAVVARLAATSASVGFAPGADGGSPITNYRASCTSTTGGTSKRATSMASPVKVTGLTTGAAYACVVQAVSAIGASAASLPTTSFTPVPPPATLAAGATQSCAVVDDGTARCWGENSFGQLGNSTTTDSALPVTVTGLGGVVEIATGGYHTCAALVDGTARCWGYNGYGQLGNKSTTNSAAPVAVQGLSGVVSIATGAHHACALLTDRTARCWGSNSSGQLGNGSWGPTPVTQPVTVLGLTGAISIVAGDSHTCALLADRSVRCWGLNTAGQVGNGTTTDARTPVAVSALGGVTTIAAGGIHSCAALADGTARCWGYGGAIGSLPGFNTSTPLAVSGLTRVATIAAGGLSACATRTDATAQCWGDNHRGQLGVGFTTKVSTPAPVVGLTDAASVAVGGLHSCVLRTTGMARCTGAGPRGELGDGTTRDVSTPVDVALSGIRVP